MQKAPYDAVKDFAPTTLATRAPTYFSMFWITMALPGREGGGTETFNSRAQINIRKTTRNTR
jgi:hypothetical protein